MGAFVTRTFDCTNAPKNRQKRQFSNLQMAVAQGKLLWDFDFFTSDDHLPMRHNILDFKHFCVILVLLEHFWIFPLELSKIDWNIPRMFLTNSVIFENIKLYICMILEFMIFTNSCIKMRLKIAKNGNFPIFKWLYLR